MKAYLKLVRTTFTSFTTEGRLFINDQFFCLTLEDKVRDVKIDGQTAIPAGIYTVKLTMSNRFKRILPLIYNKPDFSVENNGMRFTGVRMHRGNSHVDTEGCILVAFNYVNDDYINKQAEDELVKALRKYSEITLEIVEEKNT